MKHEKDLDRVVSNPDHREQRRHFRLEVSLLFLVHVIQNRDSLTTGKGPHIITAEIRNQEDLRGFRIIFQQH